MAEKDYDDEWGVMMEPYKKDAAPATEDDPFEFARGEAEKRLDAQEAAPTAEPAAPAKAMSFKEAFASNRKAGAKTFEWNGKKYTTALKGEGTKPKSPSPAASAPAVKTTPVDSTWSVVKKDNRPKVEIKAPSGSMKMTAPEKSISAAPLEVDNTIYSAAGSDNLRYFGADGKPKAAAAPAKPVVKQAASPARTSSPMRG